MNNRNGFRTIPEMEKVMEELRKLLEFWRTEGEPLNLVGVMLSSRKNLCIHPEVRGERDGKVGLLQMIMKCLRLVLTPVLHLHPSLPSLLQVVDSRCHSLTAPHVRERHQTDSQVPVCSLYETFDDGGKEMLVPPGVYNLEDLKQYCGAKGWCPYYFTRWAIGKAQVVFCS